MTDLPVLVASVVGAAISSGGLVAIVNAVARRRKVKVDAADRLSDSTLKWVDEFQTEAREARKEAAEARKEATEARREATEAHNQMRAIRTEAELLAGQLQALRKAILDPNATIERLRAIIGPDIGNGTVS